MKQTFTLLLYISMFKDEEWEDEDEEGLEAELSGQTLSSLLDQVQGEFQMLADEVEDEEDDPDAIADPVNQINLQVCLSFIDQGCNCPEKEGF